MDFRTLRIERRDDVAWIWLNRPEVRNAFNGTMLDEVPAAMKELGQDQGIHVVVLSGEGKAFCAGADLNWLREVATYSYEENVTDSERIWDAVTAVAEVPKPVVGRINGAAFGGGVGLVAAVDIAVAAEEASFALSEVRLGLVPACIAPYLARKMARAHLRELMLTGAIFKGPRALEAGLVNRAVPGDRLDEEVQEVVESLRAAAPGAQAEAKLLLERAEGLSGKEGRRELSQLIARLRAGSEGQTGMACFLERKPTPWGRR